MVGVRIAVVAVVDIVLETMGRGSSTEEEVDSSVGYDNVAGSSAIRGRRRSRNSICFVRIFIDVAVVPSVKPRISTTTRNRRSHIIFLMFRIRPFIISNTGCWCITRYSSTPTITSSSRISVSKSCVGKRTFSRRRKTTTVHGSKSSPATSSSIYISSASSSS